MYDEEIQIDTETADRIYSVTELNREVRFLIEKKFRSVWVEAEVSNFKHHSSGHMYLTLKDESSQVSAAFFSRYNRSLKFDLKNGMKVLACCRVSVYEARGQYQLYIEKVQPKGMGELQLAFLQLKEKLSKEGLFDPGLKKAIPTFPRKIGVVTSPTGAAIKDILNVLFRRFKGIQLMIYPVRVQGDGAAEEIAEGIRDLHQIEDLDVMIVGRGGGSLEDLWCFNEEIVARAIFDSKIPVISAVGHEIDWTISDMVADLRAPTPSAAAELVVQNQEHLERQFQDYALRSRNALTQVFRSRRDQLERVMGSYAFKQPRFLIDQFSEKLDDLSRKSERHLGVLLDAKKGQFREVVGRLNALSPLAILERGYAIAQDSKGKALRKAKLLKKGDSFKVKLHDGELKAIVDEVIEQGEVYGR